MFSLDRETEITLSICCSKTSAIILENSGPTTMPFDDRPFIFWSIRSMVTSK